MDNQKFLNKRYIVRKYDVLLEGLGLDIGETFKIVDIREVLDGFPQIVATIGKTDLGDTHFCTNIKTFKALLEAEYFLEI